MQIEIPDEFSDFSILFVVPLPNRADELACGLNLDLNKDFKAYTDTMTKVIMTNLELDHLFRSSGAMCWASSHEYTVLTNTQIRFS